MNELIIRTPIFVDDGRHARLAAQLVLPGETRELWFQVDSTHADKLSVDCCDGFLVASLPLAMRRGLDIVVEGPLSSRLYYNVTNYLIEVLRHRVEGARRITVTARQLTRRDHGGRGVFTGFSGGVDSFCTILGHLGERVPAEYRVTHLLFNNVGSHGQTQHDARIFRERFVRLQLHAESIGLPLIAVDSNLDSVVGCDFEQTVTVRNLAVPLLFQAACSKFLISSAYHYVETRVHGPPGVTPADPVCVPLCATETAEPILSGAQYSRFEKVELISTEASTWRALDVCTSPRNALRTNCSKCDKCLRTQLSLEIVGALQNYGEVFDLEIYQQLRWLLLCDVLASKEAPQRRVREELVGRNFPVPRSARLFARLVPWRLIRTLLAARAKAGRHDPALVLSMGLEPVLRRIGLAR